jgi:hypothetical protein
MSLQDLRQNFGPLFGGDLGRDLDELERRTRTSVGRSQSQASAAGMNALGVSGGGGGGGGSVSMQPGAATGYIPPHVAPQHFAAYAARAPLVEHHHLVADTSLAIGGGGAGGTTPGGLPGGPIAPMSLGGVARPALLGGPGGGGGGGGGAASFQGGPGPASAFAGGGNGFGGGGGGGAPVSLNASHAMIRGPSPSGAWSLLPPQIPRPLGLQRFLDQQFSPATGGDDDGSAGHGARRRASLNAPSSGAPRSSMATRGSASGAAAFGGASPNVASPGGNGGGASGNKRSSRRRRGADGSGMGAGVAAFDVLGTSEDEFDMDPIARSAAARRQQVMTEALMHSGGGAAGVTEFAHSIGVGAAEAVAAKMASEVARQAAQKPGLTPEDLQTNLSSAGTSKGPRSTEVQLMRRRLERIDDGLARAAMRQQLAHERLRNVVASGLVSEGGVQTDGSLMPVDTGARPRNALLDPSHVDVASLGGASGNGNGGGMGLANADEKDLEIAARMRMMQNSSMLLMPAVPYEHFKHVAVDPLAVRREREAAAAAANGEGGSAGARAGARSALETRLDQLQLANEEVLVRNRIVPTQPDQMGSARPAAEAPVDATSVLGSVNPRETYARTPGSRAAPAHLASATVEHLAAAYRQPHPNVGAPAGGYGSVLDGPRTTEDASEAARWARARALNDHEQLSMTQFGAGAMTGAGATAQMRSQQDDSALVANGALRTLPPGSVKDNYDARKKWANVSFETPGSTFRGVAVSAIDSEARALYGLEQA